MNKGINVLSLFDGMSCGQLALQKLGIKVNNYFASELDKHAIKVTQHNFPGTTQLGDVCGVKGADLPKIDLLIGGSPCQGFSFAGKQLNFEDPRSKLFFEYVRLLKETNPSFFLLENVRMKKEYKDVISYHIGVEPVPINSNLLSAQNRPRLYWTNLQIGRIEDKGIKLADILEKQVSSKYIISSSYLKRVNTSEDSKKRFSAIDPQKALCMTARQFANWKGTLVTAITERRTEEAKKVRSENMKNGKDFSPRRGKELHPRSDQKMNCLTAVFSMKEHSLIDGCANYRKLTPTECERLQTVPDGYTGLVSNSQRYKMLGNGWTVDVIAHILQDLTLLV